MNVAYAHLCASQNENTITSLLQFSGVQPGSSTNFKHIYTLSTNEFEELAVSTKVVGLF